MPDKKNTIGRFEIIEKIGEGPIGAVYKALDPVIRRTVAIKVIKLYALEETTTFAEVFEKIYRVVRTSTSLNHPNICIIYDLSEEKKIPYITMEYVEGHDLESLLRRKHQFKRQELLNILQQTCDALDFAHKKNVIHQDLKSSNILATPDLQVKITDFGIAGLDEIAAAQTKKLFAIPYYISPEQALGERVTPASDLFSLGVVIYYLLSGKYPFPGTTAPNTIMMIARDVPAVPADLNRSAISKEDWNSFFNIALAKSPNQRFRSAREMLEALHSILPASDQTYYPYGFPSELNESTGKLEKTYIDDAEPASPTLLIDASKIMEEASQQKQQLNEPTNPFGLQSATEPIPIEEQETEPVEVSPTLVEPPPAQREQPPQMEESLEIDYAAAGMAPPQTHKEVPQPVTQPEIIVPPEPESAKTELMQNPFAAAAAAHSAAAESKPGQPPPDFIPASGDMLEEEKEEQDYFATMAPREGSGGAMAASDTSPIAGSPTIPPEPPIVPAPAPPASAPTQMLQVPSLDSSKGNGSGPAPVESATLVNSFRQEPPAPQPPAVPLIPNTPKPAEPTPPPFSAPTQMMQNVHQPASGPEVRTPAAEPAKPVPVAPPKAQAPPVHPLSKPLESKPAAPAAKPPAMQRYFLAAIAIVIFIALVGGGILFFRKPAEEVPTPDPQPPKQAEKKSETKAAPLTSVEPVAAPTTGNFMITSEPSGATVTVGDIERGMTPVEVVDLPVGKHLVKLQLKGYQPIEKEIEITADNLNPTVPGFTLAKAAVNGTLIVDSEPTGAFIVIANRVMGVTPKTISRKPGNYEITLKKEGYLDYTGTAIVAQDKRVTFKGTLSEVPKPPAPVVEAPKPKPPEVTRGQLVTLGPDVVPPKPLKKVYAKYPDAARVKKLEGTVRMNVLVDETGRVLDVRVTKSAHPMLDEAVVKAYQQWTFQPATKQGVPVKVWITVSMSFQAGR